MEYFILGMAENILVLGMMVNKMVQEYIIKMNNNIKQEYGKMGKEKNG